MDTTDSKRVKILIVEDDHFINLVLKKILTTDYDIEMTTSALDALAYLQSGNLPDMIISDYNMPNVSGLELLGQLQASSFYKFLPVIILSGENSSDIRIKCLDSGADDYVLKPFNPLELVARIRAILRTLKKGKGVS